MIQPMPPEAYQLGTPLATYAPKPNRSRTTKITGAVLAAIGVIMIFADMAQYHPVGLFVLGGLLLAAGLWVAYTGFAEEGLQVQVFPDGLTYTKRGATEVLRWDDIAEVLQQVTKRYVNGAYVGTTHIYTLRRPGKPDLQLNDTLVNVEALGNTAQQEIYRRRLPQALAAYNAGAIVPFGKLSISQAGLSNGKETIAWSEIKGVKLDKGIISVSKQGKWLNWSTATVAQTPNIFVFTALVDSIVGINK